ncbi:site-2 protease family protein [soil metagenome]
MGSRGALTLFRIRGIRVGVDYSWFLVLFLVIIFLSSYFGDVIGSESGASAPYLLAVISAIAFFGSVLLHELGHAVVALRNGIQIEDITLWLFGGVARMSRDADSAGTEFRIAAAGPAVTMLIAIVLTAVGVGLAGSHQGFFDAMVVNDKADISGPLAAVAWLASINILILVFNLIPAFPLDGGRIIRAVAWRVSGNRNRATLFAARLGQGFSYLFIGIGVLMLFAGNFIGGVWLALIGMVLGGSARASAAQSEFAERISDLRVSDVMDAEPVAIPESATVERALDEFFLRYQWAWFPVVDGSRFRGLLERAAADAVPEPVRGSQTVADVFSPDASGSLAVRSDAPLETLLGNDSLRRLGAVAAVDAEGILRGVITIDQVGRAIREAVTSLPPAASPTSPS